MNIWTQASVDLANQQNYLDALFEIYPLCQNPRRELTAQSIRSIQDAFDRRDDVSLIQHLLKLDLFPIKDSYVAYLKREPSSIHRNPQITQRLAGALYDMGMDEIIVKCTLPKETNRQIGPLFKSWLNKGTLGAPVLHSAEEFLSSNGNAVLNMSDEEMKRFANRYFSYKREKGLDFIARFNGKYVVGEAKFLTAFGGHQNAQFDDAISTINATFRTDILNAEVIPIAILDGVLYIPGKHKLYRFLEEHPEKYILSGLLLREFLFSL